MRPSSERPSAHDDLVVGHGRATPNTSGQSDGSGTSNGWHASPADDTERLVSHCRELLVAAIRARGGLAGAVFSTTGGLVEMLASAGVMKHEALVSLEALAQDALSRGRTVVADATSGAGPGGRWDNPVERSATPVLLDGEVVAVLALVGLHGRGAYSQQFDDPLEPMLLPIALAVDRIRVQAALHQRGDEISALRRQLDAYAVDFRSTYAAEQVRSKQLAAALGELESTYRATVRGLAVAVEAKDECTGGHLHRVTRYGMMLTALVAPEHAKDPQFEYGFLLHDVGKLTIPDIVLMKAGPLDDDEWATIREHPESGRLILEDIPFLDVAREIVHSHHERWDGKGYPRGLRGDEIPLGAQVFPLCDAFDAMTSDRPYRPAGTVEAARAEVLKGSGTQFWPAAVEAFLSVPVQKLEEVRAESRTSERL